jgi:GxxExxY protein
MATNANLIYPELSYKLMGILFKVHSKLGSSYQEKYYQRAIEQEFKIQNIKFQREIMVNVEYADIEVGKHFLDFVVENRIVLETKTDLKITPDYIGQVISYLKSSRLPLGIIANFRTPRLTYRRIINPEIDSLVLV